MQFIENGAQRLLSGLIPALLLVLVATGGCRNSKTEDGRSEPTVNKTKLERSEDAWLTDVSEKAGIKFAMNFLPNEQGSTFKINLYDHGCGVAVGDYNGDGLDDIYFLNQLGPNSLYKNLGDGRFEDATGALGVALADRICVGATFADYDNDGDQDLFVTSTRGGNVLFRNDDNKRLVDATKDAKLEHVGHSQTAVFFDFDNDGDLDLYLANTAEWTLPKFDRKSKYYLGKGALGSGLRDVVTSPKEFNLLYENKGDGTFSNVTETSGLKGRGWCGDIGILDYDSDGHLDVVISCMFGPAQLYRNLGDGTFKDVTKATMGKTPFGGVGVKVFDYDNDGHLDIYIVDMHSDMWMGADFNHESQRAAVESERVRFDHSYGPMIDTNPNNRKEELQLADELGFSRDEVVFGNALYRNLGNGSFEEVSQAANMETFWPWGIATGDFNNDGWEDVFVASGMGYPFYYWHNYLMINQGTGRFREDSFAAGAEPPAEGRFTGQRIDGKEMARSSRCAAVLDIEGDGRLDIVTNNFNHRPYLFHNSRPKSNFIAFRLQGTTCNRDAVGAVVKIEWADGKQIRQMNPAGGYLSQSSKTLHFGLGKIEKIDRVTIAWPGGEKQELANPPINQLHKIVQATKPANTKPANTNKATKNPAKK